MGYIAIDLGSTNIKVAAYDDTVRMTAWLSEPVEYIRDGRYVEFDVDKYFGSICNMINKHIVSGNISSDSSSKIILTGQAESLVVLGENGKPLMNAISWMDERSEQECEQLSNVFTESECYNVTGQRAVLPTWPATKILWLKHNRPNVYNKAAYYVLLKDYIVYRLTGKLLADCSIATFSFYFDIHNKCYWDRMLNACGIVTDQLPPLVEPCTNAGKILDDISVLTGLSSETQVNIGTLDHFAGMIGTGNVKEGIMSLSTGTVIALATMAHLPLTGQEHTALHYGFIPNTYVFLPVLESGGICLEWYKENFMSDCSYKDINKLIREKQTPNEVIFLPYIAGTNAPDFAPDASGMFYGLRVKHDAADLAYAVMEGVAHLLAKNISEIVKTGIKVERIIATGGGAKSDIWSQLYADISGIPVDIPADEEAACLGAAIIGAVDDGKFLDFSEAAESIINTKKRFKPNPSDILMRKHRQFNYLYESMLKTVRL